jgi:hypothetical protein
MSEVVQGSEYLRICEDWVGISEIVELDGERVEQRNQYPGPQSALRGSSRTPIPPGSTA